MWNGKKKAVTFSFDDGVMQDIKTIEILNKYDLKATFNINSGNFGLSFPLRMRGGRMGESTIISADELRKTYKDHEVAVHTLSHYNLTELNEDDIIWQVEEDRKNLEKLVGYPVRCMAYPCGGVNNDDRVANIIKNRTKIKFARTVTSTGNFDLQENLYQFNPTVYMVHYEEMIDLARKFIKLKADTPKIFYIWGHAYEFDMEDINYEKFEEFCKLISGKEDIYYGTNAEIFLNNSNDFNIRDKK